jgi:hypothetical protein
VATSLALLLAAIVRRQRDSADRVLDFCTMGLSATVASPIAWEHHYGILLPIFSVLLASTLRHRRPLVVFIGSYVLASNFLPATQILAGSVLNVLQSYLLAAVLAVIYRQRVPEREHDNINQPSANQKRMPQNYMWDHSMTGPLLR